jgi:hypothetical protein
MQVHLCLLADQDKIGRTGKQPPAVAELVQPGGINVDDPQRTVRNAPRV